MAGAQIDIPVAFARHTLRAFGKRGEAWLERLPSLVRALLQQWELELGAPFELRYNYVVAVMRADGSEAVLKVGVPDAELLSGIAALRACDGDSACILFEADANRYALLMERVRPGEMLVGMAYADDEEATRIGARILRRLWRPAPSGSLTLETLRPLAEWFTAYDRHRTAYVGAGPFPSGVFDYAERLARDLLSTAPDSVLLHGDFQHYNVLSSERCGWLAIDPKGLIGDPGYDVGPFLSNPSVSSPERLRRRLEILSEELNYDAARLRHWGIAYAVLSACWSAEDEGSGWEDAITTAETLMQL